MKLFQQISTFAIALLFFMGCNNAQTFTSESATTTEAAAQNVKQGFFVNAANDTIRLIEKTADEWKAELTKMEYYVLREAGTERAFSGDLWDQKEDGTYTCAACSLPLFDSRTKFKSGTGWPSYYEPVDAAHVAEKQDVSHGMRRVEVLCARCGGHLGHVFEDGPKPTGLRYCINSVSLDFEKRNP